MPSKPVTLLTCIVFLHSLPMFGTDLFGNEVSVTDGDTIEVLHNNHPERIRLNGIDCPEKGQTFGK